MTTPTKLVVCPTSHMDWDWVSSFEEYYKIDTGEAPSSRGPAQLVLDAAVGLAGPGFRFSLAELAWLRRYLVDSPQNLATLVPSLSLLGGGWVSPDNLVCDGEVFVRNYLLGRTWARTAGLGALLESVAWLPDDFGHNPELPIILAAMGLGALALARVPGAFPNDNAPLAQDGKQPPSMACALMASGVAFQWQAADGSTVFAHFMPYTYGVPFYSQGDFGNATYWRGFVDSTYVAQHYPACSKLPAVAWPGDVAFAPAGGDFAISDSGWAGGVTRFNDPKPGTTEATIGTFSDYVQAVVASKASLVTQPLDPSNFWTGFFGSRPALKRLQAGAARALIAAEAVSSLLWLTSLIGSSVLTALDGAIADAWSTLVPSSHHDYVTGTAPDRVYKMEQAPRLTLARSQARTALRDGLQALADLVTVKDAQGQIVVVVNATAGARAGVTRLERTGTVTFGGAAAITQELAGGGMLVAVPSVPGLAYQAGVLVAAGDVAAWKPPADSVDDVLTIDNGTLAITVDRARAWAITSIVPAGAPDVLAAGQVANALQLYDDSGSLYQYGNEPGAGGQFTPAGALTGGAGRLTERGPLRWRIDAEVAPASGPSYHLRYTLVAGESLIRMEVTGAAPAATTVVTTFPALATDGTTAATRLCYGTAHHYHLDDAPAYWTGPTFKATHDFLLPAAPGTPATFALAAIYHAGMPAWSCDGGQLLGSLFRNTDGQQRGAAGTDPDPHTQRYALRIAAAALDPSTGQVWLEAQQFAQPLLAAVAAPGDPPACPITLGDAGFVASAEPGTLIRIARPAGVPISPSGTTPGAMVALRLYRPAADGTPATVTVTLGTSAILAATLVTALEEPIAGAPPVAIDGAVLQVPTTGALTTVLVTVARPATTPWNGLDGDPNC